MPNTIVVNTMTESVSEYSNFAFQSIIPGYAASPLGLFSLTGNADNAVPIVATVTTGRTLWGTTLKKTIESTYLAISGSGISTFSVIGNNTTYDYPIPIDDSGESRPIVGQGIRENYLAFKYSNTDGAAFLLDNIEVNIDNTTRRM